MSKPSPSNQYGLLSEQRAEKFELLETILLKQKEAIIVCGCEGIGKTTLLKTLKKYKEEVWVLCLLTGFAALNFAQIQTQLSLIIRQRNPELENYDLQSLLNFCEWQQQPVVLLIDDAINLASGLLNALTECALENPVFRLVFVFTREQLYLKKITDKSVEECYFLEIPALTKAQTLSFLQDPSRFPHLHNDIVRIDGKFLAKTYQRTAGVPGKIIAQLPLLVKQQQQTSLSPWLRVLLVVGIVALSVVFFQITQTKTTPVKTLKAKTHKNSSVLAKPDTLEATVATSLSPVKEPAPFINTTAVSAESDENWLFQQVPENYTLQLMALSKRQSLVNIVQKYPALQAQLKILPLKNQKSEKYILVYGSFADAQTATQQARLLPAEFKQGWARMFSAVQKDAKTAQ